MSNVPLQSGMTVVYMGHTDGHNTTLVKIPEGQTIQVMLRTITHSNGVWNAHSRDLPAWVESSSNELESQLASFYGCNIGRPDDWES